MNKRELVQMALDALTNHSGNYKLSREEGIVHGAVCDALEAELAKPEPEPAAWTYETALSKISFDNGSSSYIWKNSHAADMTPLYRKEDL